MILRRANPLLGAVEEVGPGAKRVPFWAQKSLDFQGSPIPMALVMDIARLKIIKLLRTGTAPYTVNNRYINS